MTIFKYTKCTLYWRLLFLLFYLIICTLFFLPLLSKPYNSLINYFDQNERYETVENLYKYRFLFHEKIFNKKFYNFNIYLKNKFELANFYLKQTRYSESIDIYLDYYNFLINNTDKDNEVFAYAKIFSKLGVAYLLNGELEKAEEYTKKSIDIYLRKEKYSSITQFLKEGGLKLLTQPYVPLANEWLVDKITDNLINLSLIKLKQKKIEESKFILLNIMGETKKRKFIKEAKSNSEIKKIVFTTDYLKVLYILSFVYYENNELIKARKYAEEAYKKFLKYNDNNKNSSYFSVLCYNLALIYYETGNFEKFKNYSEQIYNTINIQKNEHNFKNDFCSYYFYSKLSNKAKKQDSMIKIKISSDKNLNKFCNKLRYGIDNLY